MNRTIVIYHKSDFDGIFCREIARKFLPDAELIGWEYGDPAPAVPPEATLYIMDLSVPELMLHPNLIWIDHHKTAMALYPAELPGYRIDGVAACRLAWQWFLLHQAWDPRDRYPPADLPGKQDFIDRKVEEPPAVRLAGEYDIWDKRDPDAELFQHGLRSQELRPGEWRELLTDTDEMVIRFLEQGSILQYAKTQENAAIIRKNGFTIQWEGLTFLCCNAGSYNSHLFAEGIRPEHDGLLGFCWRANGCWSVSLYGVPGKPDVDLSIIATKYKGGGHKQACGFTLDRLPFLPPAPEYCELWLAIENACGKREKPFNDAREFMEFVQKMRGRLEVLESGDVKRET